MADADDSRHAAVLICIAGSGALMMILLYCVARRLWEESRDVQT